MSLPNLNFQITTFSNFDGEFRIPVFEDSVDRCVCNIIPNFPTWAFCFRERCFQMQIIIDGLQVLDVVLDANDLMHGITLSRFFTTFKLVGKDRLCTLLVSSTSSSIPDQMLMKMLEPGIKIHYRSVLPLIGIRDNLSQLMCKEIKSRLRRVPDLPPQIMTDKTYYVPFTAEEVYLEVPIITQSNRTIVIELNLLSPEWDLVHSCDAGDNPVYSPNCVTPRLHACAPYRTRNAIIIFEQMTDQEKNRNVCLHMQSKSNRDLCLDEVFGFPEAANPSLALTHNTVFVRITQHLLCNIRCLVSDEKTPMAASDDLTAPERVSAALHDSAA